MVVDHLVFDADASAGFLRFCAAALGVIFSPFTLVSRATVGKRHHLHLKTERCILGDQASCAEFTIGRVRAESNDAHRLILRGRSREERCSQKPRGPYRTMNNYNQAPVPE